MGIYVISGASIIICILTILLSRMYVRRAFNSIDEMLNRMLSKESFLPNDTTGDDRISKLNHKARRILSMNVSELAQTKDEKDTIQGFISEMSHQMKTPLSGISMYVDLLLEGNLTPEEEIEFLSRIKASTDKLQWMMDNLIKMLRLEVGTIHLNAVPSSIKQTISDAIASVFAVASKKNISIEVSDFIDISLFHDSKWTREAISNIIENAIKYSPSGSEIKISVESLPLYSKQLNLFQCLK